MIDAKLWEVSRRTTKWIEHRMAEVRKQINRLSIVPSAHLTLWSKSFPFRTISFSSSPYSFYLQSSWDERVILVEKDSKNSFKCIYQEEI